MHHVHYNSCRCTEMKWDIQQLFILILQYSGQKIPHYLPLPTPKGPSTMYAIPHPPHFFNGKHYRLLIKRGETPASTNSTKILNSCGTVFDAKMSYQRFPCFVQCTKNSHRGGGAANCVRHLQAHYVDGWSAVYHICQHHRQEQPF